MVRLPALLSLMCVCSAAFHANVTVEYQQIKEGQGPHCVDKEGSTRSLGETWQEQGRCSKTRCLASVEDKAILQVHRCNKVQASADCEIFAPSNKEVPYPDCCPKLVCKST